MILKNYKIVNGGTLYYLFLGENLIDFRSVNLRYMEQHIKLKYEISI